MDRLFYAGIATASTMTAILFHSQATYYKNQSVNLRIENRVCGEQLSETQLRFDVYQHAVKDSR